MKRIYKYELIPVTKQKIDLPSNSKVLSVKPQNENIVLYVLVDPEEQNKREIEVLVYGTGHDIFEVDITAYTFIDTVPLRNGQLMFHVFYM